MPVWASISRSAARVRSHLHCMCLDRTRAQWRFVSILTRIRFIPLESYLHSFRHLKLSMTDACYGNLSISEKRWSTLKRCEYFFFLTCSHFQLLKSTFGMTCSLSLDMQYIFYFCDCGCGCGCGEGRPHMHPRMYLCLVWVDIFVHIDGHTDVFLES